MERLPGLFHLDLNASQEPISKNLNYRIKVMNKLKRDIPGQFTYTAASNLLGVFLFYSKRISEAIQEFQKVLSVDKNNINALANLIFVYQRLQMTKLAECYEEKKNCSKICDTARAIQFSEQGLAYRFDCYLEKDELERCQKSIDLYHESLKLLSEQSFVTEINFWLIQCLQQKFNASVRRGDERSKCDCYNEGIRLIRQNIEILEKTIKLESAPERDECSNTVAFSSDTDQTQYGDCLNTVACSPVSGQTQCGDSLNTDPCSHEANDITVQQGNVEENTKLNMQPIEEGEARCNCSGELYWKAMTLTYLGIYLSKNPNSYWNETGKLVHVNELPDVVGECGFENYFQDPELCFKEAVQLMDDVQCLNVNHGNGTECRRRYAIFLRNKDKSLDTAVDLLDNVLSHDSTESDWFALTTRSQINEKRARRALKNEDQELGKQYIQDAIRDAEKAQTIQSSASEFARTGTLYRFKAKKFDSPDEMEMSKLKASENFLYALQSIGEEKRPEIHRMHGTFFNSFGEHRLAIECFKRGIASDTAERETFSFKLLFETFLYMRQKGNKTNDSPCSTESAESIGTPDLIEGNKEEQAPDMAVKHNDIITSSNVENQNVLYEMVYWFKFAYERYGKPIENRTGVENHHHKKVTSDMKKIVQKFTSDYKREMADIAAHFDVVLGKTAICEYIVACSDDGEEWNEMFSKAADKWKNKHLHTSKRNMSDPCPYCGSSYQNIKRQNSVFPGPQVKSRCLKYEYDFYIIYSDKDEDWVLYYLLTGLERTHGFKGAIAERDFFPGSRTLNELDRIFDQSFKVLLVLSEHFNNDPMCSFGMCSALTKQLQGNNPRFENYVIPIVKARCIKPPQLASLHALDATSDLDWENLSFSLESKL